MLLSLFLLLVPIVGLSCGTATGKHLEGVEGMEEVAAALVFLRLFGVEGVDAALLFFPFFAATSPSLFFFFFVFDVAPFFGFFASIISLTFVFLVPAPFFGLFGSLEDGAWTGTKAKGHGVATSFEAQTDFNVLQEGLDANYPETCDSSCAYHPSNNKINQSRFEKLKKSP
jgi:hypothetical protein